ncbi:MAG: response regulator [Verrucomicrobia bacterium]|nr:response regulator [Verrucomicrobiota bacterium]MBV9674098.1 response regulator [Verrucomicrobiota bacterium]
MKTASVSVLVVDDEPELLQYVTYGLEAAGYKVFTAFNGFDALETLTRSPEIQLVFLDFGLPGMTGLELLRWINRSFPQTRAIIATGYDLHFDQEELDAMHVAEVLTKPYTLQQLVTSTRKVLVSV